MEKNECIESESTVLPHASPLCVIFLVYQTVEHHLRHLGARHVEGCGEHEDHHEFSVDEIEEAISRVRKFAADPSFEHACIVLTQKDFARQETLWASILSRYASELWTPSSAMAKNKTKIVGDVSDVEGDNSAIGDVVDARERNDRISNVHSPETPQPFVTEHSWGFKPNAEKDIKWGAYILQSELQVVESDSRFSSQKAALAAILRISIDNFRRRNFV